MKGVHATIISICTVIAVLILVGFFPTTNVHTKYTYIKEPILTIRQHEEVQSLEACGVDVVDGTQYYWPHDTIQGYTNCVVKIEEAFSK